MDHITWPYYRGPLPRQMSREEFLKAQERLLQGDESAKLAILIGHARFLKRIARKYKVDSMQTDDLCQEGVDGLISAAKLFDPSRKVKFTTMAKWRIMAAMTKALDLQERQIRISRRTRALIGEIRREQEWVRARHGRNPNKSELVATLEAREANVTVAMEAMHHFSPLDAPVDDAGKLRPIDFLEAPEDQAELLAQRQEREQQMALIAKAIPQLTAREKDVLEARFREEPESLESIGKRYGVTKERARQIEKRALARLRDQIQRP